MLPKNNVTIQSSASLSNEVVVKLRTDNEARRVLAASARGSEDATSRSSAGRNVFERLFEQNRIQEIVPVFTDTTRRGILALERGADRPNAGSAAMEDESAQELSGLNIIKLTNADDAESSAAELSQDPLVEYAHVPAVKLPAQVDPLQNRQWGLRAIDYFNASNVPGYQNASNVKIAVLDSGVDPFHPDLQGIISDNQNFSTLGPNDTGGHGTHVIGIIAAVANNGIGITGVCQSTQIMSLKGLVSPYQAQAYYNAIRYAFNNGAQVLNCSLGGGKDPTEELLMRIAISNNVIVVAAMGNDYLRGDPTSYPAALPDVISVGACNEMDQRSPFSQTGRHIDLVAPGSNILSTVPTYPSTLSSTTDYDAWDGTSMATPIVAAAVALMLAKNPNASRVDIVNALHNSATQIGGQTGFTNELGYGRLNLPEAIRQI